MSSARTTQLASKNHWFRGVSRSGMLVLLEPGEPDLCEAARIIDVAVG